MSENEEQSVPDWVVRTPAEQRALDAQRPNKRPKYGGRKKGTPNKRTLEKMHAAANDAVASQDGRQFNCRKAGSLNKRTVAKLQAAEYELAVRFPLRIANSADRTEVLRPEELSYLCLPSPVGNFFHGLHSIASRTGR
jgi:hypothetical protein